VTTQVSLKSTDPLGERLDALLVLLHEKERPTAEVDAASGGAAARAIKLGDFTGEREQVTVLYGVAKPARIALVGVGPRKTADAEALRRGVGAAVRWARKRSLKKVGVLCPARPAGKLTAGAAAAAATEGAMLAGYTFERHKSEEGAGGKRRAKRTANLQVIVFGERAIRPAVDQAVAVSDGANLARDLGNAPGNFGTPRALADAARKAGRAAGFKVKVLEPAAMKKLNMGGLLGVAKGSTEPPRFIEMDYSPKGKRAGGTVVLVGTGLPFDAGGISIKPADKMWEMKFDKCGGCAVIGAMQAVAAAKLPIRVVGLVPSTENMPSGSANKPGDILQAANGKTIEVLNTDAEGRLILADALAYSARFKPDLIVDLATLTGSVMVALGDVRAAVMGTDEKLARALQDAGDAAGERLWPLPMDDDYGDQVKGEVGDVKNLGKGRLAGSIAGGWFLRNFVPEGVPWAHLDIAGTAWNSSDPGKGYIGAGATGFGVRLLFEFLRARAGGK
jgi:leucyl aminopeptidase